MTDTKHTPEDEVGIYLSVNALDVAKDLPFQGIVFEAGVGKLIVGANLFNDIPALFIKACEDNGADIGEQSTVECQLGSVVTFEKPESVDVFIQRLERIKQFFEDRAAITKATA